MVRPRWHDALIIAAIVGLLGAGVWALWWDDVRGFLGLDPPPSKPAPTTVQPVAVVRPPWRGAVRT